MKTFEELGVSPEIRKAIEEMGYENPFLVFVVVFGWLLGVVIHVNPRTSGSLWSSGKGRILQEGRINACLVATVRSFVHQAQTPHLKESRTKKAADRTIRGLFSLLTTYGTKNHPERILNCFFHPSDRSCEG